jgi:cell fate regulator YaaT (PSP1 superfamily)
MVRIAPVRLAFNPKTLWFNARDLDLAEGDNVVVLTARGMEYGTVDKPVFEADEEQLESLHSKLKPVKRKATEEDDEHSLEMQHKSAEALPRFKELAAETVPDMNPVSVEYLFDGDKAVFYFESEERVDFRALVRKLASEFHVRVDMKQIGVRDEARMIGGVGHCGQELCCRRLGGDFNPVSIRMAKEQDLSLNPQKISGLCGRLMCCLRYEYDAYKDFHARAPKKNAKIKTPEGTAKVTSLDVPREIVSMALEGEKPVNVPLADMDAPEEGKTRPDSVGEEAWEAACNPVSTVESTGANALFTSELDAGDRLADPKRVRRVGGGKDEGAAGHRPRRRHGSTAQNNKAKRKREQEQRRENRRQEHEHVGSTTRQRHARMRRSMRVDLSGEGDQRAEIIDSEELFDKPRLQGNAGKGSKKGGSNRGSGQGRSRKRRESSEGVRSGGRQGGSQNAGRGGSGKRTGAASPGRNSSALRQARANEGGASQAGRTAPGASHANHAAQGSSAPAAHANGEDSAHRRRRRTHHAGGESPQQGSGANASGE